MVVKAVITSSTALMRSNWDLTPTSSTKQTQSSIYATPYFLKLSRQQHLERPTPPIHPHPHLLPLDMFWTAGLHDVRGTPTEASSYFDHRPISDLALFAVWALLGLRDGVGKHYSSCRQ